MIRTGVTVPRHWYLGIYSPSNKASQTEYLTSGNEDDSMQLTHGHRLKARWAVLSSPVLMQHCYWEMFCSCKLISWP